MVTPGMIVSHLLTHIAPEAKESGSGVSHHHAGPQDLRHRSRRLPTPDLQLEEPVSGHVESLGEEEVVLTPGIDVRHAPTIPQDLHRCVQTIGLNGALLRPAHGGSQK